MQNLWESKVKIFLLFRQSRKLSQLCSLLNVKRYLYFEHTVQDSNLIVAHVFLVSVPDNMPLLYTTQI